MKTDAMRRHLERVAKAVRDGSGSATILSGEAMRGDAPGLALAARKLADHMVAAIPLVEEAERLIGAAGGK